ncbi:TAP2 protein, partial [Urocynchramus pylzowi]|nr:TAP2 protein [Urocynchramus pylzowi]
QALQRSMMEASARTASGVQESVAAMETIRTFSAEEEEEEQHRQNLAKELRLKEKMELELAFFTLVERVMELAIRVLVLFRSHQQLRDGYITPGVLVTFLLYRDRVGSHVQVIPWNAPVCPSLHASVHPGATPFLLPRCCSMASMNS